MKTTFHQRAEIAWGALSCAILGALVVIVSIREQHTDRPAKSDPSIVAEPQAAQPPQMEQKAQEPVRPIGTSSRLGSMPKLDMAGGLHEPARAVNFRGGAPRYYSVERGSGSASASGYATTPAPAPSARPSESRGETRSESRRESTPRQVSVR